MSQFWKVTFSPGLGPFQPRFPNSWQKGAVLSVLCLCSAVAAPLLLSTIICAPSLGLFIRLPDLSIYLVVSKTLLSAAVSCFFQSLLLSLFCVFLSVLWDRSLAHFVSCLSCFLLCALKVTCVAQRYFTAPRALGYVASPSLFSSKHFLVSVL